MKLSYKQQNQKDKCIRKLGKIKKFELINRLLCYACVLPFFHATACLGQNKNIPLVSKVGSVGFVVSTVAVFSLKDKKDKYTAALNKLANLERN